MPEYDIVVVGGGTAGAFAAATAARAGVDVVLLERKPPEDAGQIACGDAIKGTEALPNVIDLDYLQAESFTNNKIQRGIFHNPKTGEDLEIPFDESGAVIDRKRYGEVLLEEAERLGADIHYKTVVTDVLQSETGSGSVNPAEKSTAVAGGPNGGGQVVGVSTKQNGSIEQYTADVVIDAAGALSILQERADFSDATFDTNVRYTQYCSAYREVLAVAEPVEWLDALIFEPTEQLGYVWYFPRSETQINAGIGFQMSQDPFPLADTLTTELSSHPTLGDATVIDKRGAALPTRRPFDSAVADGFLAAGDAAGHVNPTTGGGIPVAAKAGHWAARQAVEAISDGDVSEQALWGYNHEVMTDFGKRFAAADLYNIWGMAHSVDELTDIVSAIPGQQLLDTLAGGRPSMSLRTKIETLLQTAGYWGTLYELYRVRQKANEMTDQYEHYPQDPAELPAWQRERDTILEDVYEICNADPKY